MGEHALERYGKNFAALRAWVEAGGEDPITPAARNGLGALAEIVVAIHLGGDLVAHIESCDVRHAGRSIEVRTRSDGKKPDYRGKSADIFADVRFALVPEGLRAERIRTRTGTRLDNDGENRWDDDKTFKPFEPIVRRG